MVTFARIVAPGATTSLSSLVTVGWLKVDAVFVLCKRGPGADLLGVEKKVGGQS